MPLKSHLKKWVEKQKRDTAKKMRRIAVEAKRLLQEKLNTAYPPASVKGQYPRRRTGNLRNSVVISPNSEAAIMANGGRVTLKYNASGFYGNILVAKGRRGPDDVIRLRELQTIAQRIMNAKK